MFVCWSVVAAPPPSFQPKTSSASRITFVLLKKDVYMYSSKWVFHIGSIWLARDPGPLMLWLVLEQLSSTQLRLGHCHIRLEPAGRETDFLGLGLVLITFGITDYPKFSAIKYQPFNHPHRFYGSMWNSGEFEQNREGCLSLCFIMLGPQILEWLEWSHSEASSSNGTWLRDWAPWGPHQSPSIQPFQHGGLSGAGLLWWYSAPRVCLLREQGERCMAFCGLASPESHYSHSTLDWRLPRFKWKGPRPPSLDKKRVEEFVIAFSSHYRLNIHMPASITFCWRECSHYSLSYVTELGIAVPGWQPCTQLRFHYNRREDGFWWSLSSLPQSLLWPSNIYASPSSYAYNTLHPGKNPKPQWRRPLLHICWTTNWIFVECLSSLAHHEDRVCRGNVPLLTSEPLHMLSSPLVPEHPSSLPSLLFYLSFTHPSGLKAIMTPSGWHFHVHPVCIRTCGKLR